MTEREALDLLETGLLPPARDLYGLRGYSFRQAPAHDGGRNLVCFCEREGAVARVLRISFLEDRGKEDYRAEVEFVRYLHDHGAAVADVVASRTGNLVEEVVLDGRHLFLCLFERARGMKLVENGYRYREGVPLAEYFFACGKTLGKLHALSKGYEPVHRRHDFFDVFNAATVEARIPGSLPLLKERMVGILRALEGLERDRGTYGLVHFDFNDGNWSIDFETGGITAYDFDNSCTCWFRFDLASLWLNGTGWVQFERDAGRRREFMEGYFEAVLAGYRSETPIEASLRETLPLFIQASLLEAVVDAFDGMRNRGGEPECDEALSYRIRCLEGDIPYMGFFHDIYSCERPFEADIIDLRDDRTAP